MDLKIGKNRKQKNRILIATYSSSIHVSFIAMIIVCILEILMLMYSYINSALYGQYLGIYRSFYLFYLFSNFGYFLFTYWISKDIRKRYQILNYSNPIISMIAFLWSLGITYYDTLLTGSTDPTLFMTFSLALPISIFIVPKMYVIITTAADLIMLYIIIGMHDIQSVPINTIVFFIFQLVLGVSFLRLKLKLAERIIEEEDNAGIDGMTGLYNRRAYNAEIEALKKAVPEDLVYLAIDVNSLKETNDNLGHEAGDKLIIGTADCLEECFGDKGKLFRIGGDEFAALLHMKADELDSAIFDYREATKKWSGDNGLELATSLGYSCFEKGDEKSILDMSREADKLMYADKEKYYIESGKDRR
ncbi:GGDEF domain-containing protein [Butyrivibrio sp. MC2013]|uniref:GGDEF domain-containing protein n=1 Tax=Butyrivibrio sp. MC2013 TaxID=1280686 RepID=UPI00041E44FC|nr:GGDEF domain-containing protein [Butyrivibrio sp. MC2013]